MPLLGKRKRKSWSVSTNSLKPSFANDTLPVTPALDAFQNFIGRHAFEDDGGWSYEVWTAAWNSATDHLAHRFKSLPYDELGQEFVNFILTTKENPRA